MENENHESKIDVRIVVQGLDIAQMVSKAVGNIQLERDYNIIVSSIIPTTELNVVKKVAKGADIILIGSYGRDETYNVLYNELKTDFNNIGLFDYNNIIIEDESIDFNLAQKEILNSKIYDIKEVKTGLSKEEQLEKWGVNYKTSETIILNEDLIQKSSKLQKDDKQLFNAIYASFIKQNTDRKYSSGSDFVTWARNAIGKEVIDYSGEAGFINVLKTRLQAQDAPTISSSFSGGLHAVNAISLVQDIENPNYYYIGVYDNNYPGEKRYVDLECKKGKCYTVKNNYYTSSKQPIRLTPSLEEDLSYYQ